MICGLWREYVGSTIASEYDCMRRHDRENISLPVPIVFGLTSLGLIWWLLSMIGNE